MRKITGVAAAAVLVLAGSVIIWINRSQSVDRTPPSVILISVDTLRADHLACYGYERATSPSIDALADGGVRFTQAFCQASWTLPSHMSLLTSRFPHSHGVETDKHKLSSEITTLAEVMRRAGYKTSAFISWVYLSEKYGFGRGFDAYHELLPSPDKVNSSTDASVKASAFVDRVIQWVDESPQEPFFLFLHLFDPHINYEPPPPFDEMFGVASPNKAEGTFSYLRPYIKGLHHQPKRISVEDLGRARALYDGEIRYVDQELGRLMEALRGKGLLDNTLVVFTSDHGEELDDHGSMEGHQWTLYDEVLRVPLIMSFPDSAFAGEIVSEVVQSIDVGPTILDYLDLDCPEEFQGQSLLPLLNGSGSPDSERMVFSEIKRFNDKWAVRTSTHKLIYTRDMGLNRRGIPLIPGFELYNLTLDPKEQNNVYDESDSVAQHLARILTNWRTTGHSPGDESSPQLDERDMARLRDLGYVE